MHTSPNAPSGRLADSTAGMALCSTTAASHLPLPDESTETGSLENSNTASLFLDTNLRLTRYTDEGPNVLNAPPTALQHIWTDWVPVGCSTTLLAEVQKTLSSAIQCHRVVHANDTWYGVRVAPHHTESNDIAGVVLTFSTLSAPASTTDASIIPSSAVINALDLPIVVLNSTGEVQRVNAAYNAFTGYTADSQVGQPVASLVAASDQPRLAERIQNVMSESCASTVLSLRWRTSEGDNRDMESRCVPLKDTRGVIHGVLLMGLFSPVLDPARHMMSENAAARHHVGEELHESLGMELAAAAMKMQNLRAAVARGETIRPEARRAYGADARQCATGSTAIAAADAGIATTEPIGRGARRPGSRSGRANRHCVYCEAPRPTARTSQCDVDAASLSYCSRSHRTGSTARRAAVYSSYNRGTAAQIGAPRPIRQPGDRIPRRRRHQAAA